jgi:glycine cleavage system H protein
MTIKYTADHEWLDIADDTATVGITEHAAAQLGDLVFLEMREAGTSFAKGDAIGVIESVKAASEIYAPVDGEIIEVNAAAAEKPTLITESAESSGWLVRIRIADIGQLAELMDLDAYKELVE